MWSAVKFTLRAEVCIQGLGLVSWAVWTRSCHLAALDFSYYYYFFNIRKLYHLVPLSLCKMVMKILQVGQDGEVREVWDVPLQCHRIH